MFCGWVNKRPTPVSPPPMQRVYCVLWGSLLLDYESEEDAKTSMTPKNISEILGVSEWDGKGRANHYLGGFLLVTHTGRNYYVSIANIAEREEWILQLRRSLECIFANPSVAPFKPGKLIQNRHPPAGNLKCPRTDQPVGSYPIICTSCGRCFSSAEYVSELAALLQLGSEEVEKVCVDCKNAQLCVLWLKCLNYVHTIELHEHTELVLKEFDKFKASFRIRRRLSQRLDMAAELYYGQNLTAEEFEELRIVDEGYRRELNYEECKKLKEAIDTFGDDVQMIIALLQDPKITDKGGRNAYLKIIERILELADQAPDLIDFYFPQLYQVHLLHAATRTTENLVKVDLLQQALLVLAQKYPGICMKLTWSLLATIGDFMEKKVNQAQYAASACLLLQLEMVVTGVVSSIMDIPASRILHRILHPAMHQKQELGCEISALFLIRRKLQEIFDEEEEERKKRHHWLQITDPNTGSAIVVSNNGFETRPRQPSVVAYTAEGENKVVLLPVFPGSNSEYSCLELMKQLCIGPEPTKKSSTHQKVIKQEHHHEDDSDHEKAPNQDENTENNDEEENEYIHHWTGYSEQLDFIDRLNEIVDGLRNVDRPHRTDRFRKELAKWNVQAEYGRKKHIQKILQQQRRSLPASEVNTPVVTTTGTPFPDKYPHNVHNSGSRSPSIDPYDTRHSNTSDTRNSHHSHSSHHPLDTTHGIMKRAHLGWDPTTIAGEPQYRITKIIIEECRVFRTKARAPSLIICEVVRDDLYEKYFLSPDAPLFHTSTTTTIGSNGNGSKEIVPSRAVAALQLAVPTTIPIAIPTTNSTTITSSTIKIEDKNTNNTTTTTSEGVYAKSTHHSVLSPVKDPATLLSTSPPQNEYLVTLHRASFDASNHSANTGVDTSTHNFEIVQKNISDVGHLVDITLTDQAKEEIQRHASIQRNTTIDTKAFVAAVNDNTTTITSSTSTGKLDSILEDSIVVNKGGQFSPKNQQISSTSNTPTATNNYDRPLEKRKNSSILASNRLATSTQGILLSSEVNRTINNRIPDEQNQEDQEDDHTNKIETDLLDDFNMNNNCNTNSSKIGKSVSTPNLHSNNIIFDVSDDIQGQEEDDDDVEDEETLAHKNRVIDDYFATKDITIHKKNKILINTNVNDGIDEEDDDDIIVTSPSMIIDDESVNNISRDIFGDNDDCLSVVHQQHHHTTASTTANSWKKVLLSPPPNTTTNTAATTPGVDQTSSKKSKTTTTTTNTNTTTTTNTTNTRSVISPKRLSYVSANTINHVVVNINQHKQRPKGSNQGASGHRQQSVRIKGTIKQVHGSAYRLLEQGYIDTKEYERILMSDQQYREEVAREEEIQTRARVEQALGETFYSKKERLLGEKLDLLNPNGHHGHISNQQRHHHHHSRNGQGLEFWPAFDLKAFIVKTNDDLRQEICCVQIMQICKEIFEHFGLGNMLFLKPYRILCTGPSTGIVEVLTDSTSLDALKKTTGFTTLSAYFKKTYDISNERLAKAKHNFMSSLAAYSLFSYLLLIKDRHNGNLLIDAEGHIIHIDFGFLLSIAPGGSFSIETAPFKLTEEMVDLLGGLDSPLFGDFVTAFTKGFIALQANCENIISAITVLAKSSTFPCFQGKPVNQILEKLKQRFRTELGVADAVKHCLDLITNSYGHYGTKQYDSFQYYTNGIFP